MGNSFALAVFLVTGQSAFLTGHATRLDAKRAVALLPVVGVLIGIVLASAWAFSGSLWFGQSLVAAAIVYALDALATGGRPLGGLARAADGLASDSELTDRSRAFAVMRDSRRGTFGLVGLVGVTALKLGFLSALASPLASLSIVLTVVLGRWATAFAFAAFPLSSAAGGDSETQQGLSEAGPNELLAATLVVLACASLLSTRGLLTVLVVGLAVGTLAQSINRRFGGLNPSLCQAFGEVGELAALACLSVR